METAAAPSDDIQPLSTMVEGGFRTVYDVPFVLVNQVENGEYAAEVVFSGDPEVDLDRVRTALAVGRERGVSAYARVFDEDVVWIYFSDDPSKGLIWALSDELSASAWLQ
jgi:hypothetical protein